MKRILLLLFLFSIKSFSQNLVPNPSFEDTVQCPTGFSVSIDQVSYATGWHRATMGSADYFNSCNTTTVGVPQNYFGWEQAKTGNAYVGIFTFSKQSPSNYREYIQTKLTDTLLVGIKYQVSFYVSLADSFSSYACNNIGAYLSSNAISVMNAAPLLSYIPQISNNPLSNPLTSKNGWTYVADTFTASGGELYITIGNFNSDAASDTVFEGGGNSNGQAYYYIDDVKVWSDSLSTGNGSENSFSNSISLSPNPATTQLTIESKQIIKGEIEIYDVMGKKVDSKQMAVSNKTEIDISLLEKGVYYLKISSEEKTAVKKFIKI